MFRKSLKGYNREEVDSHIEEVNSKGEEKLSEIVDKFKAVLNENSKMKEEIQRTKLELEENDITQEFMDFLEVRLENIPDVMMEDAENEIRTIDEASIEKINSLDGDIGKLKNYFKKVQENFNILIKTVVEPQKNQGKSGFKVIQCSGRTNHGRMLQNDSGPETEAAIGSDIIGKIAGKDVITKTGEKIIDQGTAITEDVIKKVESAGKLSELIINMVRE